MPLNDLVQDLLSRGGVKVPAKEGKDALTILESWLDSATDDEWESETMEDAAPFNIEFYSSLEKVLIHTWQPEETSTSSMLHSNPLMELDCEPKDMTLEKAMPFVRMTRLLRLWMELNIQGRSSLLEDISQEDARNSCLSHCLLRNPDLLSKLIPNSDGRKVYLLVQALYFHIEQLPFLQSQINFYTQSLMKSERNASTSGQPLTNPNSRLSQYMESQKISTRLNQEWQEHINALEYIICEWYALGSSEIRRQTRAHLGSVWAQFVARSGGGTGGVRMENTTSSAISMTLKLLLRILKGSSSLSTQKSYEHLLTYHLIPLHRPNSMVLWRDQTSLLELYHEPLVQCIAILLQHNPGWIPKVLEALIQPEIWTKGGNTPKLVLLLHEIDTYLGILPDPAENPHVLGDVLPPLLRIIGDSMASDHSRLAERALTFVKTKNFKSLIQYNFEVSLRILLPYLVKQEPSWNPTVRKMTYNVLKTMKDMNESRFLEIAEKLFPKDVPSLAPQPTALGTAKRAEQSTHPAPPKDFTLKAAMGTWRPPTRAIASGSTRTSMPPPSSRVPRTNGSAPPLGVTGVAPWSMASSSNKPFGQRQVATKNPPLGVTGVAPWALQQKPHSSVKRRAVEAISELSDTNITQESRPEDMQTDQDRKPRVIAFMEQIKPAEEEQGLSSWSQAQMAETPTLLPNLKFHDLVFGHDLGAGAFGSVKYARHIDRSRGRSQWPEYAVKNISTEKISEMGYEASVQREIAVLRIMSHPSISRLVSSFRFREGVYLVLEYASGGDLHSLLKKNGSLDHDSTRFVIGEVVAALSSIHELGFVYGDLKPENIVITESGHIKITDFGGCRPVTEDAKRLIHSSAKNILKGLRDGDWKPKSQKHSKESWNGDHMSESESDGDVMDEDLRIEGTTAYLPPEVVMGAFPTPAADSWALGCVMYQCLSGRPPILEADDSQTKNKIVSFGIDEALNDDEHQLFGSAHASGISVEARSLILKLLSRHASERPQMDTIAQHDFFAKAKMDVFTLYQKDALPLDTGDVTPTPDAQWSRRQFSSIWAPQPQSYDISVSPLGSISKRGNAETNAIVEMEEASAYFSKSSRALQTGQTATMRVPLPSKKIEEE